MSPAAKKLILHTPLSRPEALPAFVEEALQKGIRLIACIGEDAYGVEEDIDDLIVGDGSDARRFITTTAHMDESLNEVMAFARGFGLDNDTRVEEIRL